MGKDELLRRTKEFGLSVIRLSRAIPNTPEGRVIRYQILKSGTSVGANYRAARRAKSLADFISKMGIVEEETDETMYWLEMIVEADIISKDMISGIY
ncbi:MAG: four helix bundle protein [Desulfohalobiaceae bacterium]|nr:four helix bundle protein [Desulfohalobiaceae bacterium]